MSHMGLAINGHSKEMDALCTLEMSNKSQPHADDDVRSNSKRSVVNVSRVLGKNFICISDCMSQS